MRERKAREHQEASRIRSFHLGEGLPSLHELRGELDGYRDILLGREDPPTEKGILTLMEVAEAFHARARALPYSLLQDMVAFLVDCWCEEGLYG